MKNHTEAEQPTELVTRTLRAHQRDLSPSTQDCSCGWSEGDDYDGSHAAHQSRVLADAGLIPTQREWGVRDPYSVIEFRGNEHAARTFAGGGADTIVSRWVGATDWEVSGE